MLVCVYTWSHTHAPRVVRTGKNACNRKSELRHWMCVCVHTAESESHNLWTKIILASSLTFWEREHSVLWIPHSAVSGGGCQQIVPNKFGLANVVAAAAATRREANKSSRPLLLWPWSTCTGIVKGTERLFPALNDAWIHFIHSYCPQTGSLCFPWSERTNEREEPKPKLFHLKHFSPSLLTQILSIFSIRLEM